jgi:hypothetical protein
VRKHDASLNNKTALPRSNFLATDVNRWN